MVFIGDGLSDLEAVHVADQVYARDELLEYCQEKDIPAIGFTSMEGADPEVEGTLSDRPIRSFLLFAGSRPHWRLSLFLPGSGARFDGRSFLSRKLPAQPAR